MQHHHPAGRRALGLMGPTAAPEAELQSMQTECDALGLDLVGVLSRDDTATRTTDQIRAAVARLGALDVDFLVVNHVMQNPALEIVCRRVFPRAVPLVILSGREAGAHA